MVRKYFRHVIAAACVIGSMALGSVGTAVPSFASGMETATEADDENAEQQSGTQTEKGTERSSEQPVESDEKTPNETLPQTETATEKQPEASNPVPDTAGTGTTDTSAAVQSTPEESSPKAEGENGSDSESGSGSGTEKKDESESDEESESEAEQNEADVTIESTPDSPDQYDSITQTVNVKYNDDDVSSRITYNIDKNLAVKTISTAGSAYLRNGKAVITSSSGDTTVDIADEMDLSGYTGVTKIVFIPRNNAWEGTTASFTARLSIQNTPDAVTSSAVVTTGTGGSYTDSVTNKLTFAIVAKPEIRHTDTTVPFGEKDEVTIAGFGVNSYAVSGNYNYTVQTPDFLTIDEIVLPEMDKTAAISVYLTDKSGTETQADGTYTPGSTVKIGKSGISSVRFEFVTDETEIAQTKHGTIVTINDNKENKTDHFSWNAIGSKGEGAKAVSEPSDVLDVSYEIYTEPQSEPQPETDKPDEPETDKPKDGNGKGRNNNPGQNIPTYNPEPETNPAAAEEEAEKEKRNESMRAAEDERKNKAAAQALEKEQMLKDRQNALLSERLNAIRGNAKTLLASTGGSGSTGSTRAQTSGVKNAEGTVITPISEDLVKDKVPAVISPIDESLVANVKYPGGF